MGKKILVAYATKYGATAKLAQEIGQTMCEAELQVDVLPVNQVKDLAQYKAIVLGSAVYIGLWRKEAAAFLNSNAKLLSELPVWIFSSGPTGVDDPMVLTKGWRFPEAQRSILDQIHPRDISCFHGKIDPSNLNLLEKFIIKKVKAPIGDFHKSEVVRSWTKSIVLALKMDIGIKG